MQAELGDVVYVELPEVGTEVEQGNNFGVVESVKVRCKLLQAVPRLARSHASLQAASDTFSPVTGEVVETNQKLVDEPGTVSLPAVVLLPQLEGNCLAVCWPEPLAKLRACSPSCRACVCGFH